jgi:hypothetical protein
VWDNCGAVNSDRLEKVQTEAARIVTGLTSYASLRMSFGMMIVCLLIELYCDDFVDYSYLIRQLLGISTLINILGLHYL